MSFTFNDAEDFCLIEIPNQTGTPERRLLAAILERAILDYVGNDPDEAESASSWLFDDDGEEPQYQFSCAWVCEALDLDYRDISARIKAMPKRGASRVAPWYLLKNGSDRRAAQA